jgi:hypothetical protein
LNYELHPLCTLFPRLAGAEFAAMRRFSGIRRDRLAIADFQACEEEPDRWHFSLSDVLLKSNLKSIRPIAGECVALLLEQHGGREMWALAPQATGERPASFSGSIVYFLQAGSFIKIGITTGDPRRRIDQLQTGCPYEIRVLGCIPGGRALEQKLHKKFSAFRAHGEWFRMNPEILQELRAPEVA